MTTRTMTPGELEAHLMARLAAARERPARKRSSAARRTKRLRSLTALSLTLMLSIFGAVIALAVHENPALELDGNTTVETTADDWNDHDDGVGDPNDDDAALVSAFQHDEAEPDLSHHEPSNKDDNAIDGPGTNEDWGCVVKNNVNNKDDLRHAYAAAYDIGGDLHLFFGADRDTNNGSANIAAWFFQNPIDCDPAVNGGKFTGHKTDGDLFIVSEFTNGGRVSGVNIYIWTDPNAIPEDGDECLGNGTDCTSDNSGQDNPFATGIDCQITDPHADPGSPNVCATVNGDGDGTIEPSDSIDVPWEEAANDPEGSEFFEGGLNLDALFPTGLDCFSQVMIETRSSFEFNANLFDLSFLDFDTCGDITAHKYLDVNGNGQDDGEPDLEGWTINLFESDGTTLIDSADTDADGDVFFGDLNAGTYVVCEVLESATPPWVNTDPAGTTLCETVVLGPLGHETVDFGNGQPDIEITKAVDQDTICAGLDTEVTYTFTVSNPGNVDLSSVAITDDQLGTLTDEYETAHGGNTLAAGDSETFTVNATLSATTVNIVTAGGNYGPATPADTDTATATVTAVSCDIEITKSPSQDTICAGLDTLITYTFTVSNDGDVDLTNVSITDNVLGDITADYEAAHGGNTLAAGDSETFTVDHTISATTMNTVTATGDALGHSPADTDTASATVTAVSCDIEITKQVSDDTICLGTDTEVTYTFTVSNPGDVDLTNVVITDDQLGTLTDEYETAHGGNTLAAGDSETFMVNATLSATTTNIVTASGSALGHSPADSDTATATVTAVDCTITLTKEVNDTEVCAGDTVTYSYVVHNNSTTFTWTGDIRDDNGTPGNLLDDFDVATGVVVAPGMDSATFTHDSVIGLGTVTNTATATGDFDDPATTTATDTDDATTTGINCGGGCTPGFWQGGFGAELWNDEDDPDWAANGGVGTNPFDHETLFNDFFTDHSGLNGKTMLDVVGTGGGNQWYRKAARDVVAAYLNASFGVGYPFTTAQIEQMWTDAVNAGGNSGFRTVHDLLGAANELGCTIGAPAPVGFPIAGIPLAGVLASTGRRILRGIRIR